MCLFASKRAAWGRDPEKRANRPVFGLCIGLFSNFGRKTRMEKHVPTGSATTEPKVDLRFLSEKTVERTQCDRSHKVRWTQWSAQGQGETSDSETRRHRVLTAAAPFLPMGGEPESPERRSSQARSVLW